MNDTADDNKLKKIDVLLKEHEIVCTQIREMVSYSDRILGVGVTILGAVFLYGIKEKVNEITIATPFALTFLLLFCSSVFSAILTLGGYRRYLEDAFESQFGEQILRWEYITPRTLHSSFATTNMFIASFALLLASMFIGWTVSQNTLSKQNVMFILAGYAASISLLLGSYLKVRRSHSDAYLAASGLDSQLPLIGFKSKLLSIPVAKNIIRRLSQVRGEDVANQMMPFIDQSSSVLDLGCGTGGVSLALFKKGFNVVSADIKTYPVHPEVSIQLIEVGTLPYSDNQFDVCLLHVTLHHATDKELLIREAARVAKKVIIGEELVDSVAGRVVLILYDKIVNFSFANEAHENLPDTMWRKIFRKNNLTIVSANYSRVFGFIRQVIYVLEK
jgi:SAM-dependent methyltransferase